MKRVLALHTILVGSALLLAGCVALTSDPRALIDEPEGVRIATLQCQRAVVTSPANNAATSIATALDPRAIRIVAWNLHKQDDPGWEGDLAAFAHASDILLLQEVNLQAPLTAVLRKAGLRWILASSFTYQDADNGVLTAARVAPVATCTQRALEPLIRIPKSAVITWLPLIGRAETLAIANVHAINFTITLDAYRAQLDAVADILSVHRGPVVLAGDFNTWSKLRLQSLHEVAARLQLDAVPFVEDTRSRFLGLAVDHVFVRGLTVTLSRAQVVTSSDHNPLQVHLQALP